MATEHASTLTPAGTAVLAWCKRHGKSQQWLVDRMNELRTQHGVVERIGRGNLWRWMNGRHLINVDDATLIRSITGIPVMLWSKYDLPGPASARPAA